MNHERLVVSADEAVNPAPRKVVTRNSFAAVQVISDVRFDEGKTHLKQRDIDELPPAGFVTSKQRRHDPMSGKNSGGAIGDGEPCDLRMIEIRHQTQHAAERLPDRSEEHTSEL